MMIASPPPYNFASTSRIQQNAPVYSADARQDECLLEHTPTHSVSRPSGKYLRTEKFLQLALKEQVTGTDMPSYGRHGLVKGKLTFTRPRNIISVDIKIEGSLTMALGNIGRPATTSFLNIRRTLWQPANSEGATSSCPSTLAFDIKLPSTFRGRDTKLYPLPPSCEMQLDSSCSISCQYSLKVIVSEAPRLAIIKKKKSSTIAFNYRPQTPLLAPPLPVGMTFLDSLMIAPEAWFDVSSTMQAKPTRKAGAEPIKCHLYIPSDQLYSSSSPIPFHLELTAPAASLRSLYSHKSTSETSPIRVSVMRHISANSYGNKIHKVMAIGESELRALPPPIREYGKADSCREDALRWDGIIALNSQAETGGFLVDDTLSIQDFIVLSIIPPNERTSPLLALQHKHRIRLVADR
ncbi:hypothetical protein FIBSPDRAFT_832729 [Athelia psychrophila]|uniref:Arrestin-like N-terminal domain-containing protein n=1 Tax=Athelia psychrophila TaxID=1759441 RepID=A0A166E9W9_9AGAM|nr:hypothetical protein FIBSPDRAFT_832729 [Fibularhizoctonia sp. CBS 109695]